MLKLGNQEIQPQRDLTHSLLRKTQIHESASGVGRPVFGAQCPVCGVQFNVTGFPQVNRGRRRGQAD